MALGRKDKIILETGGKKTNQKIPTTLINTLGEI